MSIVTLVSYLLNLYGSTRDEVHDKLVAHSEVG